ncbi:MAG: hypothetical protein CNLJKLNK_00125 [Holosporales bacterium]
MIYQHIWDFLTENPLSALTVAALQKSSCSHLYDDLRDDDLYKLLFRQMHEKVEEYFMNPLSMNAKDTLFDLALSVGDFYQDKKIILKQIEQELYRSRRVLCDFYVYTQPTIQLILNQLQVQSIVLNNIPIVERLPIPSAGIFLFMQVLLGYFVHTFIHSIDEESLMTAFNDKLSYIDIFSC